jgi:hypothetical protein
MDIRYPITASVTLVQLDETDQVHAYVHCDPGNDGKDSYRLEFKLGNMSDAVDFKMWMQMMSAKLCDAL